MNEDSDFFEPIDASIYAELPPRTPNQPTLTTDVPLPDDTESETSLIAPTAILQSIPTPTSQIASTAILQSIPTSTPTMPDQTKAVNVFGGAKTLKSSATMTLPTGAQYRKEARPTSDDARLRFLQLIKSNQQISFQAVTVSSNDPEKMVHTHSISTSLSSCEKKMTEYDFINVFMIYNPKVGCFTPTDPNYKLLHLNAAGDPEISSLFTNYLRLSTDQVALSTRWQAAFLLDEELIQENLNWSLAYFEKNVEKALYDRTHQKMIPFDIRSHGGPLFLKLLLEQITTTSQANLKQLLLILETYVIKTDCKGENINVVVDMFTSCFNNINALSHDILPANSVKHLLDRLQTTSVDDFNSIFHAMAQELAISQIRNNVNPSFSIALSSKGASVVDNDMKSVTFLLAFANAAYTEFCTSGLWTAVLQKPPGGSSFLAAGGNLTNDNNNNESLPINWTCFNCGKRHHLKDCDKPKDPVEIAKNRANHPNGSNNKNRRTTPHKWRPPESGENNKRVINQKPHTWDPNARNSGSWIPDTTESSGQPELIPPTQANLAVPIAAAVVEGDKPARKLAIHLAMEAMKTELASL